MSDTMCSLIVLITNEILPFSKTTLSESNLVNCCVYPTLRICAQFLGTVAVRRSRLHWLLNVPSFGNRDGTALRWDEG